MAFLRVISGPSEGKIEELHRPRTVVGRHPACNVVIRNPEVSRYHAEFHLLGDDCFLEDLRSRNGTYLNDDRIRSRCPLREGDRVRIGPAVYDFHPGHPSHLLENPVASGDTAPVLSRRVYEATTVINGGQSGLASNDTSRSRDSLLAERRALLEITRSLRSAVALDEVLPQILDTLSVVFPITDRGFIVIRKPSGELFPQWIKQWGPVCPSRMCVSRTVVNRVLESKQALLSVDAASDARFEQSDSLRKAGIHSMMCAPLIDSRGEAFGVLQVDTCSGRGHFSEADLEVLSAVANQASIAIDNARLHEEVLQQRAIERELDLADQIQRSYLPKEPPVLPGFGFDAFYQPASQVGGDYYNYVGLPGGQLAVVTADVTGHGLAAAMLTARVAAELHYALLTEPNPACAMRTLNATRYDGRIEGHFVTLLIAVVAPSSGSVTLVSAGHVPPLLRTADGRIVELGADQSGMPLGILPDVEYEVASFPFAPGEMLLMYTDGIREAMDRSGAMYGLERMRSVLSSTDPDPAELSHTLAADVRQFVGPTPANDDMCWVCIRRER
jgi:sigma-B regulation protein RsbU (phosphoserine phosphatase)